MAKQQDHGMTKRLSSAGKPGGRRPGGVRSNGRGLRATLLIGSAGLAIAAAMPDRAEAQLSGLPVNVRNTGVRPGTAVAPVRPASMRQAVERQAAREARAVQMRALRVNFRDAVLAASRIPVDKNGNPDPVTDGISDKGLNPVAPIRGVFDESISGQANVDAAIAAAAAAATSGSGQGWVGVNVPTQTVDNGETTVNIVQTQQNAVASWQRFDVGANTTVNFVQRANGGTGAVQSDWTLVNRVVDSIAPSTILGNVNADANLVVLNSRGVIFGQDAQVNLRSLVVSSLDIGNQSATGTSAAVELAARNRAFIENGLFALRTLGPGASVPLFLSPLRATEPDAVNGGVFVDPGARISSTPGGYLVLAGPTVENRGLLNAVDGQVSLQGGLRITAVASSGASDSVDPSVRGFIFRTLANPGVAPADGPSAGEGTVLNAGLIESRRGYISLGAGTDGIVTNSGYLGASTSVSRNGKIELTAGTVTLAGSEDELQAGAIVILPDSDGTTVPIGTEAEPNNFRPSEIVIGARAAQGLIEVAGLTAELRAGEIYSTQITFGQNSFLRAPGANLTVGRSDDTDIQLPSFIDIQSRALIDVSGIKDFEKSVADNILQVTPVKRNELRDTPTYREVLIGDGFTLNGSTLYIDIRESGVRADGVNWIGSPLIEAASLAGQIPVTAAELMTVGGTVSLATFPVLNAGAAVDPATVPLVRIARDATIDFSGGWVTYTGANVFTSRLLTADGRSVDISAASPNDIFVDVVNGVEKFVSKNGVVSTASQTALSGQRFEAGYDEGRDAGALIVTAPQFEVAGANFDGAAYAGLRQRLRAEEGSADSAIDGDPRNLQTDRFEMPSGGLLSFAFADVNDAPGSTRAVRIAAAGTDTSGSLASILTDAQINGAKLGALRIETSGGITLDADAAISMAPGGIVEMLAGRTIDLAGDITAASGVIDAATFSIGTAGASFDASDDIPAFLPPGSEFAPFDILVGGTLDVAGLWTNDRLDRSNFTGSAYRDGGSISLRVAPKELIGTTPDLRNSAVAIDLSGSILIDSDALIDVRAGGYVAPDGTLQLDATGGDVSLINETVYANLLRSSSGAQEGGGGSPIGGANQSVEFTPEGAGINLNITPGLVPENPQAKVEFSAGNFLGFGFAGGGTFSLVAPEVSFGSATPASAHIGLDFFQTTGFGTLDVSSFASRIRDNLFTDDFLDPARTTPRVGSSAFLSTTTFRIRDGETFDLTQSLLPSIIDAATVATLRNTASAGSLGSAVTDRGAGLPSILTPSVPVSAFDRVAANIRLGGLTELVVDAGGTVTGAAGAGITTPKLLNRGRIDIRGGSILQAQELPFQFLNAVLPTRGTTQAGLAAVFDGNGDGTFSENEVNAAGVTGPGGAVLTNRQLLSLDGSDRFIIFEGVMEFNDGIVLDNGSVTDLSGTILYDPRAPILANGTRLRTGRLIDGGTIGTAAERQVTNDLLFDGSGAFPGNPFSTVFARTFGRTFVMASGSKLNLDGASGSFDTRNVVGGIVRQEQWTDAGTLSNLSGLGTVAAGTISARGGDARAEGGTFVWSRPTIYNPVGAAVDSGSVAANQIEGSGFDLFVGLDQVTFADNVDLTLGRGFILQAGDAVDGQPISRSALTVSLLPGANAVVRAPRVVFASGRGLFDTLFPGSRTPDAGTLAFVAGEGGIDFIGATRFDQTIGSVTFDTTADVRFIGFEERGFALANQTVPNALNGEVLSYGDMTFDAERIYATTGTGNLQRFLELRLVGAAYNVVPFQVTALGDSSIRFAAKVPASTLATPLSAGSYIRYNAQEIEQGGNLYAPLGVIEFGSSTTPGILGGPANFTTQQAANSLRRLTLGNGAPETQSVIFKPGGTTSVSGAGLNIPYGTTLDTTDYFFTPTSLLPLTAVPTGQIFVNAPETAINGGAFVDLKGGGDIFSFEFVSGVGGSRNVLDRFNTDQFSSNDYDPVTGVGYQFADQRQVFALVPVATARTAYFDPVYSADYSGRDRLGNDVPVDLYTLAGGRSVTIGDGTDGLAAGEYLLLPAQYALLPGGVRIFENTGTTAAAPGTGAQTLLDGSIIVSGSYSNALTDQRESQLRSFTVQPRDTILSYSNIVTTQGSDAIRDQAAARDIITPRVTADAGRLVLANLEQLKVAGTIATDPAAGGRGAEVDLSGLAFAVRRAADQSQTGVVQLTNATLDAFNAGSLFIGGTRSANADGSTTLTVAANSILIADDASIAGPETLLAVQGASSSLIIADGASILASGANADQSGFDYRLVGTDGAAGPGGAIRVATGGERLFARNFDDPATTPAIVQIGAATLGEDRGDPNVDPVSNIAFESSRDVSFSDDAKIDADRVALISDSIALGGDGLSGTVLGTLSNADQLTFRSNSSITFASGTYGFSNLVLDAQALRGDGTDGEVAIDAGTGSVRFRNSAAAFDGCDVRCAALGTLTINAGTLIFDTGTIGTEGFAGGVTLIGTGGSYVEGKGGFDAGATDLTIRTPFLADRAAVADPRAQAVRPDYGFATTGAIRVVNRLDDDAPATLEAAITGNAAPGARIAFGNANAAAESVSIEGTDIRATAGVIDVKAVGDVALLNGATLAVPSFERSFGDAADRVIVTVANGTVSLLSRSGDLNLAEGTSIAVDDGKGEAGTLRLLASGGSIAQNATLNPGVTGQREANLMFVSGAGIDLSDFIATYGTAFGGDMMIEVGTGDLTLGEDDVLRAQSVLLSAVAGSVIVDGTIDTKGVDVGTRTLYEAVDLDVNGGDVALFGQTGVTLGSSALIDTRTTGYHVDDSRVASAGDVTIGIGTATGAAITVASGAVIDTRATRTEALVGEGLTGHRLITTDASDGIGGITTGYLLVEPDKSGDVSFRAPVVNNLVDIRLNGSNPVAGGDVVDVNGNALVSMEVEAYKVWDLDTIATTIDGRSTGVTRAADGSLTLAFTDNAQTSDGLTRNAAGQVISRNLFAADYDLGGVQSVANFVRRFDVAAADGSDLSAMLLRPGFEFRSGNNITMASDWNLAAGSFGIVQPGDGAANPVYGQLDIAAYNSAIADGLMERITTVNGGSRRDDNNADGRADTGAAATPYVALVAGQEATFFENNIYMLYRTGNNAAGAAPVVSFRAGGSFNTSGPAPADVTLNAAGYSITDGFFTFDDRTDPFYTARQYLSSNGTGATPDPLDAAPFSNRANSSGALGGLRPTSVLAGTPARPTFSLSVGSTAQGNGIDPAVVFPLLGGGSGYAASSDIRIVAGALQSANPDSVDFGRIGDLNVTGERSYLAVGNYDGWTTTLASTVRFNERALVYAPVVIRTGTGDIDLSAPGDINMFRRAELQYRDPFSTTLTPDLSQVEGYNAQDFGQVGGNAAYSVGHAAVTAPALARTQGGSTLTFALNSTYAANGSSIADVNNFVDFDGFSPNLANVFFRKPVVLTDGGDVNLFAGGDILTRRDVAAESAIFRSNAASVLNPLLNTNDFPADIRENLVLDFFSDLAFAFNRIGEAGDLSRIGIVGDDTRYGIVPQYFSAGIGALGGGSATILAFGTVDGATVSLGSSAATGNPVPGTRAADFSSVIASATLNGVPTFSAPVLAMFGSGDLDMRASSAAGLKIFVASGTAEIDVTGDVTKGALGRLPQTESFDADTDYRQFIEPNLLRLSNSRIVLTALGDIQMSAPVAITNRAQGLTPGNGYAALANMTPIAGVRVQAVGDLTVEATSNVLLADFGSAATYNIFDQGESFLDLSNSASISGFAFTRNNGSVLPATIDFTAISGGVSLQRDPGSVATFVGDFSFFQLPSAIGLTEILSNAGIEQLALSASDSRRARLAGPLSTYQAARNSLPFGFPGTYANSDLAYLSLLRDAAFPRQVDPTLNRIMTNGDFITSSISMPEATRIHAGGDIVDMIFFGQNLRANDVTRVVAGGDVRASTSVGTSGLPFFAGNHFEIGGPGLFSLEAGGNVGPFLTSGTFQGGSVAERGPYAGGIVTIGNESNPFLDETGASIDLLFGVAFGANFAGLADVYLNPANADALDGDLFEQIVDDAGNSTPDRSKPIYAPILAAWLRDNEPELFASLFDPADFPNDAAGNAALADAAYGAQQQLFDSFSTLDSFRQRQFLTQELYFNELAAPSNPNGPSFNQFIRAYRAVDTLFPAERGYTDNLAVFGEDGIRRTGPDSQPLAAERIVTGNADLRLSTIQTLNGGSISILGPGGDLLAGSVVRTSEQVLRRVGLGINARAAARVFASVGGSALTSIPVGLEGLLTFNGGDINSFTDGSLRLNQSRVFTLAGGDIRAFSGNGDLNAGQGPKTSSNFPPVVVTFDSNGFGELDPRGSVAGAGIGAFKQAPTDPDATIVLVAPIGEVDAGDAGVRASGSIFVAAARVANADNFAAGGSISGVPGVGPTTVATPANADSATKALQDIAAGQQDANRRTRVEVSVLGYAGGDPCDDPARADDPECRGN